MIMAKKTLSGVYLVVDPCVERKILIKKIYQALEGGVEILQIWNNWPEDIGQSRKEELVSLITDLGQEYDVPVLINEEWELLKTTHLNGVHFDAVPGNIDEIRKEIGRNFMTGITCSNDLEIVKWADENGFDYISFCAMFPSPSVESCEIVSPQTVRQARELTDLPLFLSGGITPEKIEELNALDFNGVAVISGILNSKMPDQKTMSYKQALSNIQSRS
jgi:thiamine-phosphate pyrophosphorylase